MPACSPHLSRARDTPSLAIRLDIGFCFPIVFAALARVVSSGVSVISPKRKIDTASQLLLGQLNKCVGREPAGGKPGLDRVRGLALRNLERQHTFGSEHGIRNLGLGHNLSGTKGTVSSHLRRRKRDGGSASGALDLKCILGDLCQLLGPQFEIFIVGPLLNFRGASRNRLAASAVGARETAVARFENQIGGTTR